MAPRRPTALILLRCLLVSTWCGSSTGSSHSSECDSRAESVAEHGAARFGFEDSEAQLSLLQSSFHVSAPVAPGTLPADNFDYGFAASENDIEANQFVHWSDSSPYIPSNGGESKPLPRSHSRRLGLEQARHADLYGSRDSGLADDYLPDESPLDTAASEDPAFMERLQAELASAHEAEQASVDMTPELPIHVPTKQDVKQASADIRQKIPDVGLKDGLRWPTILGISCVSCGVLGLAAYMLFGGRSEAVLGPAQVSLAAANRKSASGSSKRSMPFLCCARPGGRENSSEDVVERERTEEEVSDIAISPPVELEADTFGMSVCAITRDSYFMSLEGASCARIVRLFVAIFLVILTISIQVFLLMKIKEFVSARAVHDIREAYDTYELAIYGEKHTTLTKHGNHRGIPSSMPPLDVAMKRLNGMSEDDRDDACRIPLSQPTFFGVILLVWTLTCLAELRKAVTLEEQIIMLKTVPSMAEAMRQGEDEKSSSDGVIEGMTLPMKIIITLVMFIPRVLITLYLLWVGCRWLLATTDFSDLIMNALALEFILLMKDTLYVALMPARNHLDLQLTLIEPYPKKMRPAVFSFANSLVLLGIASLWVDLYMTRVQQVLPEYQWDVHDVCSNYIKERFSTK